MSRDPGNGIVDGCKSGEVREAIKVGGLAVGRLGEFGEGFPRTRRTVRYQGYNW